MKINNGIVYFTNEDNFSFVHKNEFFYFGRKVKFESPNHFMLLCKAVHNNKLEYVDDIINLKDIALKPEFQNKLHSSDYDFDKYYQKYAYMALYLMVSSNESLKRIFLDFSTKSFAYISSDSKMGIGLDEKNEKCYDPNYWIGSNLMGNIYYNFKNDLCSYHDMDRVISDLYIFNSKSWSKFHNMIENNPIL